MSLVPLIPDSAPFTSEQRAWLNGFLAAWLAQRETGTGVPVPLAASGSPFLILYGSQSGTAEALAKTIGKKAQTKNLNARVLSMESAQTTDLLQTPQALIVTSTWGEGEMPDTAKGFWDKLKEDSAPRLENTSFAVLALGDTNYGDTFCWAGKQFDQRLENLGAKRFHDRLDCDLDYEAKAEIWIEEVLAKIKNSSPTETSLPSAPSQTIEVKKEEGYTKKNPFPSTLLKTLPLNGKDSAKDVRHIEFSLENSGLVYEAGDALGVFPINCPDFVQEILHAVGLTGDEPVELETVGKVFLRQALLQHLELRSLLTSLPEAGLSAAALVEKLRPLQPRLYSISSSPKAHPGQVHLTVGAVRFDLEGKPRKGSCSTFLADRLPLGNTAHIFIQTAHGFRLPADLNTHIIMVGPGTGIAPFRTFIEERVATKASGKNWLFFGDQKSSSDFLYQEQLESYVRAGSLHRLDTAFSRDQVDKIYVQDRMKEHAQELWAWLQEGAHFYVCGDAKRMAKDVDAMLHTIAQNEGGLNEAAAKEWVATLKKEKRYQRDVY